MLKSTIRGDSKMTRMSIVDYNSLDESAKFSEQIIELGSEAFLEWSVIHSMDSRFGGRPRDIWETHLVSHPESWPEYMEAMSELDLIKATAIEEGMKEPAEDLIKEAKALIHWMLLEFRFPYEVTPDNGGIAVHAIAGDMYVCVILFSDKPDVCFVEIGGESRRSIYPDHNRIRGTFLKSALGELSRCV